MKERARIYRGAAEEEGALSLDVQLRSDWPGELLTREERKDGSKM